MQLCCLMVKCLKFGEDHLNQLFAKSYGIYDWIKDPTDNQWKYMQKNTCVGGDKAGNVCYTDGECLGLNYNSLDDDGKCSQPVNFDITNTGKAPRVDHLYVNDTDKYDFVIIGAGPATLKFDSIVDDNQLPLVRYMVIWGDADEDGSVYMTTEAGLRITGRSMANPHTLVHYYRYSNDCTNKDAGGCCRYRPEVILEDNWGKIGSKDFNFEIRVCENEQAAWVGSAVITIEPMQLNYNSGESGVVGSPRIGLLSGIRPQ